MLSSSDSSSSVGITASRFCSFFLMFMKLEVLIELFISADSYESPPLIEQWGLLSSTCCFCLVNPAFVLVAAGCFNQQVSLAYIADIDTPPLVVPVGVPGVWAYSPTGTSNNIEK